MVEATVIDNSKPNKRQKTKHTRPEEVLTNVNVEEYKVNPEEFEELLEKRPVGAQIFIQFQDSESNVVGEQIAVDSLSNKAELNTVLAAILEDAGINNTNELDD